MKKTLFHTKVHVTDSVNDSVNMLLTLETLSTELEGNMFQVDEVIMHPRKLDFDSPSVDISLSNVLSGIGIDKVTAIAASLVDRDIDTVHQNDHRFTVQIGENSFVDVSQFYLCNVKDLADDIVFICPKPLEGRKMQFTLVVALKE